MILRRPQYAADPNIIFSDDFNDNSFDTAKWVRYAAVTGFTVTESGQQLNFASSAGNAGNDGVKTVTTNFDMSLDRNWSWKIGLDSYASGNNLYMIAVDLASNKYFGFLFISSTSAVMRMIYNAGAGEVSSAFLWNNADIYLRVKYVSSSDTMFWDTSPDGVTWTNQLSVGTFASKVPLTSLLFEVVNIGTTNAASFHMDDVIFRNN
jgi:hypothetical protein